MGALEAPQDKHGQEHRTGTSRVEQTTEAMAELDIHDRGLTLTYLCTYLFIYLLLLFFISLFSFS